MAEKPRRRWFQFSLRTLLLAVTLLCVWLAVVVNRAEKQRGAVETVERLGGEIFYDYHRDATGSYGYDNEPPGPEWLRGAIGIHYLAAVEVVYLTDLPATDADVERLKGLPQLQYLFLQSTRITDAGLEHLKGLKQLTSLCLYHTLTTNSGLERLMGLKNLKELELNGTQITDAGLDNLRGLDQLQYLDLTNNQVTDAAVADLQKALPSVKIVR